MEIEDLMKKLKEPWKPRPGECCGSGCNPCVWDRYYNILEKYEDKKNEY